MNIRRCSATQVSHSPGPKTNSPRRPEEPEVENTRYRPRKGSIALDPATWASTSASRRTGSQTIRSHCSTNVCFGSVGRSDSGRDEASGPSASR